MAKIIEVNDDSDYMGAIANAGDSLVVAEFYATWTAPSVAISEELTKLREDFPEVVHIRCNLANCVPVFNKYSVNIIPCVKVFRNGEELGEIKGAKAREIRDLVEANLL
ncbi:Trx-2 [Blepharisma stoltei]|uniref:Thioredoxin domain-containing protein n=1 Tax=Blepharisma stoltei TaxID=1481888 RepID=A0AAU9K919_9CILI|nr:unnamed protein product [Blepharisma stoltei]